MEVVTPPAPTAPEHITATGKAVTPEDQQWLKDQGEHWETLRAEYVKNLYRPLKEKAAELYKAYIDPKFILDPNCRDCNYKMMLGLLHLHDAINPPYVPEDEGTELVVKEDAQGTALDASAGKQAEGGNDAGKEAAPSVKGVKKKAGEDKTGTTP